MPSITRTAVEGAIKTVTRDGFPASRKSTKFCLVTPNGHLPPKYIVGLAAKSTLGKELSPSDFTGGAQTNELLQSLGFVVERCGCGGAPAAKATRPTVRGMNKPAPAPAGGVLEGLKRTVARWMNGEKASVRHPKPAPRLVATNTTLVRIVTGGPPPGDDLEGGRRALLKAFDAWPKGVTAKFTNTAGGFVSAPWPERTNVPLGWDSRARDLPTITRVAEDILAQVVTSAVLDAAAPRTQFLTLGIDLTREASGAHAELVAVYDVSARQIVRWTGKSYPVGDQVKDLFQVADLKSHLIELAGERVLVLGCHDLMMYDPRGQANTSQSSKKYQRSHAMHTLVTRFKPTVVLQHPHSTYSPAIWRNAWAKLRRDTPSVRTWGSGIAHYSNKAGKKPRPLGTVLAATKSSDVRDIVLEARR